VVTGLESLDSVRRMWFVDQILNHGNSAANLARRFKLSRFAIPHWVKRYRRTSILMSKGGRPQKLDTGFQTAPVDEAAAGVAPAQASATRNRL
jgi:transposase